MALSWRVAPHIEMAATHNSDTLAPVGPSRTAAHRSGGTVKISNHGNRASSGPASKATPLTTRTAPMMTAASPARRPETFLSESGSKRAANRTAGVRIRSGVMFASATRAKAIAGRKSVSPPTNDITKAGAMSARNAGMVTARLV